METFNEMELQIAIEKRNQLQAKKQVFEERRAKFAQLMSEAREQFEKAKTQLADKLRDVLAKRAEYRRNGLTTYSAQIQQTFAEETQIHAAQREARDLYEKAKWTAKNSMRDLFEEYSREATKIKMDATARLQQLLAEQRAKVTESEQ